MQAVTRVKLEQASKVKTWMPTRLETGEGRADREEARRGSAPPNSTDEHLIRSTGVVSTACREGDLWRVGEAWDWRESRTRTPAEGLAASPGVGEGHKTEEAG